MHDPYAPWCVGSVFFPPQLLTSDVGPLLFNQFGNLQCLLSTGRKLEQPGATISTSKQTANLVQGDAAPFIPRELLQDHLEYDASSQNGSEVHGNLLQGLKCSDGSVLLFFLCGAGADRISSTVCYRDAGGRWYSVETPRSSHSTDDSEQAGWPLSPSFQHAIQQLSAVWVHLSDIGGSEYAIVAARSYYHVYFSTVLREEGRVQFISTAVSKFQSPVAHVTWNPHVDGEAAVVLECGKVCLFDVQAYDNGNPNNMVDLIAKVTVKIPMQNLSPQPSSQQTVMGDNQEQVHELKLTIGKDLQTEATDAPKKLQEVERKWWCCEYGWLPQILLVANSQDVFLVDVTEASNSHNPTSESSGRTNIDAQTALKGIDILATVGTSNSSRFCTLKSGKEKILALGRSNNCEMFEFSVATDHHLILFDARQPQTPILQWEHGLRQDPPSLLIMCPLSALRSVDDDDKLKDIQNGRAILAASFKSGDIRVFCFGSNVSRAELPFGNNSKKQKVDGHTWDNPTHAWDTSTRLYAPLADIDDWRDVVSSSRGLYSENVGGLFVPKSHKERQNIAGIALLSENSLETWNERKKTFTMLQLTGSGELLAQTYKASHELIESSKARISSSDDASDAEQSVAVNESKDSNLRYATLPALLKYMHAGSVLVPPLKTFERVHKSKIDDHTEGLLKFGKDGMSGEAANDEGTSQESAVPSATLEKQMHQAGLETRLKAFIQDLNVPVSVYEVAQKVLCMELPERLVRSAVGMPSDLNAERNRGYKFPSVLPFLGTKADTAPSGDPKEKDDSLDHTLLSNSLSTEERVQDAVPIPLLLEIHYGKSLNMDPSSLSGGGTQTDPHGIENCTGFHDLRFKTGHKLLVEGCQYVEGLIEKLVFKTDSTVLSSSKPTQEFQGNVDGVVDPQLLFYRLPEKGGVPVNLDRGDRGKAHSYSDVRKDVKYAVKPAREVGLDDPKKLATFSDDIYCKFVARTSSSKDQEQQPAKQYLKIDSNLCPIKLSFTSAGEELEQDELMALEGLQTDFLQWQQSFPPYKGLY